MLKAASDDPVVRRLLARHPHVSSVEGANEQGIVFRDGDSRRRVKQGETGISPFGLMELIDNNPVVCAEVVSVPGPSATLALIALGPLAGAGLIVERPSFITNIETDQVDLDESLSSAGWTEGADIHVEPQELGSVLVATAMAVVPTPEEESDLFDLYSERFGKSFFVREHKEGAWSTDLVAERPWASYLLSVALDAPTSLVTVRVMADRDGKCGAAQLIHAMNIMCGFEETLGIF